MTRERKKNKLQGWLGALSKSLRRAVPDDRGVFALCMFLSLVFWVLVKMSKTYVASKPVVYELNLPAGKALTALPPADLEVEIEGTGWNLLGEFFNHADISIPIDLQDRERVAVSPSRLRTAVKSRLSSRGIEVVDLNYNEIVFNLEERVRKKVAVSWRGSIQFQAEYDLQGPVRVTPDSVTISGPASQVADIQQLQTDSFALEDLQFTEVLEIGLEELPETVSLQPRRVRVEVPVEQYTEWEQFIPLNVRNAPSDSIRIFPNRIRLSCVVGLSRFDSLRAADFEVRIDLSGVPASKDKTTVPIELVRKPDYVKHVQISPRSASFLLVRPESPPEE